MTQPDHDRIRDIILAWAQAVQRKDIEGVVANHSDDMVMFDVPAPIEIRGLDQYRKTWPSFFAWIDRDDGIFEIDQLDVSADAQLAYATALLRCGARKALEADKTARLRLTLGLRKHEGQWKIAHEHHSFPDQA